MNYADSVYYKGTFLGKLIPDDELDSYLHKASISVDTLTYNRVQAAGGVDQLTDFQKDLVQMAVCCQAEHLYTYGDMPATLQSYNAGGNSVSIGAGVDMRYSRQAVDYLRQSGLSYRGIFSTYSGAFPFDKGGM